MSITALPSWAELSQRVGPTISSFVDHILASEGGFVDDPKDAGGATNHGVSLRWANSLGMVFDLNHDGRVDKADIKLVTPEIAKTAFVQYFYIEPHFQNLPAEIQCNAFDQAVNGGPASAVTCVQMAVNEARMKFPKIARVIPRPLVVDGISGPATLQAVNAASAMLVNGELNSFYADSRIIRYRNIVRIRPDNARFLKGWINRAEALRKPYVPSAAVAAPILEPDEPEVSDLAGV